jgi:hypothetical protein
MVHGLPSSSPRSVVGYLQVLGNTRIKIYKKEFGYQSRERRVTHKSLIRLVERARGNDEDKGNKGGVLGECDVRLCL